MDFMMIKMKAVESLLVKLEKGLIEAKKMKEGELPKKPLRELYKLNSR